MLIESLSHSTTDPLNTFKYNGIHFEREGGLNSYIAPFRTLDPTIARWNSVDPMNQFLNPYVSMGGDPVSFSDPLGLEVPLNPKNFSVPEYDRPRKGYLDAGYKSAYKYVRATAGGGGSHSGHGVWDPTSFVDASGDKWAEVWLTIAAWEYAHCTGDLDWSEYSVGSYGTIEYQQFSYQSVIIRHYGASGNEGIVVAYPLFKALFIPKAEAANSGGGENNLINSNPHLWPIQMVQGAYDFATNYFDMRRANFRNSDKYFHAKANFQATHRGLGGRVFAEHFSNLREIWDQNVKGYPKSDSELDQKANLFGRTQSNYFAPYDFRNALKMYRPVLLPTKY